MNTVLISSALVWRKCVPNISLFLQVRIAYNELNDLGVIEEFKQYRGSVVLSLNVGCCIAGRRVDGLEDQIAYHAPHHFHSLLR